MRIQISKKNKIVSECSLADFLIETSFGFYAIAQHDIENLRSLDKDEAHIIHFGKEHLTIKRVR
tara:strand:+ start:7577 stop:7768 length:192 start_codon:yes stop_codon:yes gene_type:complete